MGRVDQELLTGGVGPLGMYRDVVQERYGSGARYEAALTLMLAGRQLGGAIGVVLKDHGLTMPQWSVLTILHLAPAEQIPLGRIAAALDVHATTITNAVDRLVDLGLAERAADPADRRSIFALITPAGAGHVDEIMRRLADAAFGLEGLSDNEVRTLLRLLGKVGSDGAAVKSSGQA
jgi:DNA-binding MarR family transcriptional regulator